MFERDKWPFIPTSLSGIIDKDTLSVIEAGCCERLGRAMTIIDGGDINRIDSINSKQRFEGFCSLLRDEQRVRGGNEACEKSDMRAAQKSLEMADRDPYRTFHCHMGLLDATHVIQVRELPVAVLFSGQYQPPDGTAQICTNVRSLRAGRSGGIKLMDEMAEGELLSLAERLPQPPADFYDRLKREAEHIQRIAEAEYDRLKNLWEQEFLDKLRTFGDYNGMVSLERLRGYTATLMELIRTFCRCEYAIFFASVREGDTVLPPIAEVGIPIARREKLPHLNWKKAGLPLDNSLIKDWDFIREREAAIKGIRGDNSHYFSQAACLLPASLGSSYRGVLVFGPFTEPVNLQEESRFLMEVTRTVGLYVLTELQVLNLQQERRRWESTAKLLIHQLRTTLTPITTRIGRATFLVKQQNPGGMARELVDSLKHAENLCLQLGRSTQETVEAHVLLLEPEDLEFERYPLSVLVANSVSGFMSDAKNRHLELIVDDSVELLPEAEVDVARLTIALSNLVENALKYSYPNTKIFVRSRVQFAGDLELATAIIEVDNLGEEIRSEDQEIIFEQGTRGLTRAKMGRIPGSGLGLWEARAVVEAHGGTATVTCQPTSIRRRQGQAFHVVFSLNIPLRQAK